MKGGNRVKFYTTHLQMKSIHKVAVYLQDNKHKGTVYVKIVGNTLGNDVLVQSIKQVMDGEIYVDVDCLQLLEDDYINIYKFPRRKNDFVYLLERKFVEDFIVGVKIVDCIFVKE
jgi:hypothetical protein